MAVVCITTIIVFIGILIASSSIGSEATSPVNQVCWNELNDTGISYTLIEQYEYHILLERK